MFDELRRMSSSHLTAKRNGLTRTSSKESLEEGSNTDKPERLSRGDQIKRLEAQVAEFSRIIRDKNGSLEEATKILESTKNEHTKTVEGLRGQLQTLRDKCATPHLLDIDGSKSLLGSDQELQSHRQLVVRLKEEDRRKQCHIDELSEENARLKHDCERHLGRIEKLETDKAELTNQIQAFTKAMQDTSDLGNSQLDTAFLSSPTNDSSELSAILMLANGNRTPMDGITNLLPLQSPMLLDMRDTQTSPTDATDTVATEQSWDEQTDEHTDSAISLSLTNTTNDNANIPVEPAMTADGDARSSPMQVAALLRERSLLTTRLAAMRAHLAEVKTQWGNCVAALEQQIAQLTEKHERDHARYERHERDLGEKIVHLQQRMLESMNPDFKPHMKRRINSLNAPRWPTAIAEQDISDTSVRECQKPPQSDSITLIANLESQLDKRNRIIEVQRQHLKELKRSLADRLKTVHFNEDRNSLDGSVTSSQTSPITAHRPNSFERHGSTTSLPLATARLHPTTILPTTSRDSCGAMSILKPDTGNSLPARAVQSDVSGHGRSWVDARQTHPDGYPSQHHNNNNASSSPADPINVCYIRHVLLKFLLSRESEATQLIRVLATLLYLTADEEKLLRDTLHRRHSWFRSHTRLSPSKSHGQFAKVIPPPV